MGYLSKDVILDADDLKREDVEVPEWGGTVCISEMTGTVRDAYEQELFSMDGETVMLDNLRVKLVSRSIIDPETGELMFTPGDVERLSKKCYKALDKVYFAAEKLNALGVKKMEETAKN